MANLVSRAYNSFELNEADQTITKTSKEERLNDELSYYWRADQLGMGNFFPKLISRDVFDGKYIGEFEYYAYPNLAERWFEGNCDFAKVAAKLKSVLDVFSQITGSETNPAYNHQMFIDKTETEYAKLIEGNVFFKEFSKQPVISINGKAYLNFDGVWPAIKWLIKKNLLDTPTNNFIHGDLCFSNILYGEHNGNSVVKLIDPRGSYGAKGCFGNRLYDLAKLQHSYESGYEYIIYDKFFVKSTINSIDFEFHNWNNIAPAFDCLFESEEEKQNARLIQGLIMIGMVFRHSDNLDRQKVQYATGIKILNEFI